MVRNDVSRRSALALAGTGLAGLLASARSAHAAGGGCPPQTYFFPVKAPDTFLFVMFGQDQTFGRYFAFGELEASAGEGEVVLIAQNGDQIVGSIFAAAEEEDRTRGHFRFAWADSAEVFGNVYRNTGRFARKRPPGLVVIAIIAILIGLLLPAVQKVK